MALSPVTEQPKGLGMTNDQIKQSDEGLRVGQGVRRATCVMGLLLILGPLLLNHKDLSAKQQTTRLESLAYQIFEIRRLAPKTSRSPASEGSIQGEGHAGLASNGKPYLYRVTDDEKNWVIRVWSDSTPEATDLATEVHIQKSQL